LQNAREQKRYLFNGLLRITIGELHHRILNDVERGIVVAYGERRVLECAALN
jgi:hypothetical protein